MRSVLHPTPQHSLAATTGFSPGLRSVENPVTHTQPTCTFRHTRDRTHDIHTTHTTARPVRAMSHHSNIAATRSHGIWLSHTKELWVAVYDVSRAPLRNGWLQTRITHTWDARGVSCRATPPHIPPHRTNRDTRRHEQLCTLGVYTRPEHVVSSASSRFTHQSQHLHTEATHPAPGHGPSCSVLPLHLLSNLRTSERCAHTPHSTVAPENPPAVAHAPLSASLCICVLFAHS